MERSTIDTNRTAAYDEGNVALVLRVSLARAYLVGIRLQL